MTSTETKIKRYILRRLADVKTQNEAYVAEKGYSSAKLDDEKDILTDLCIEIIRMEVQTDEEAERVLTGKADVGSMELPWDFKESEED